MNRVIKELFFEFSLTEQRVINNAIAAVVFENSMKSDYFYWLNSVVPENINIIKLKWRFRLLKPLNNLHLLGDYQHILFHSPGEVLQRELISKLQTLDTEVKTIGFQHGLIGESPPASLENILRRCKSNFYFSFEKSFTKLLQKNTQCSIIECVFDKPDLVKVIDYPLYFDCYFDAPDKRGIFRNARQLRACLKETDSKLLKLKFHPSTSWMKRFYIHVYLFKYIRFNNSCESSSAICWDSKVKYELAQYGITIYTISNENILCLLKLHGKRSDFSTHVGSALRKVLEVDLGSEMDARF